MKPPFAFQPMIFEFLLVRARDERRLRLLAAVTLSFAMTTPPQPANAGLTEAATDESAREQSDDDEQEEDKEGPQIYWDSGLHVTGMWKKLSIKLGTDVQNDTAGFVDTADASAVLGTPIDDGVEWRRARVYAEGNVFRHIAFKFRYDFSVSNPPKLQDAFIQLVELPIPTLRVTLGRFAAPLGLDGYTGADDTTFMEKSTMTTAFLPSRNTGVLFHGHRTGRRLYWSFGALQPEEQEGLDFQNMDNLGYSWRFAGAFHPGKGVRALVHAGLDFWRRNVNPSVRLASRPESHIAPFFVDTGDIEAENLNITVLENAVQRGPLKIQGELALAGLSRLDAPDLSFYGFYLQASYFLTGETAPYRPDRGTFTRPVPKRSIGGESGGNGAFEVAFRFSRIDLDDKDVSGRKLNDWSAGLNWYPTYHTRVSFNVILANPDVASPVGVFQMRLQLAY